ncbi:MAG: UDP-forming cellulose synthase catalytic subunit [Nitrospiraceae bacterium]
MPAFEATAPVAHSLPPSWRLALCLLRPRALMALLRWSNAHMSASQRTALKTLLAPPPRETRQRPTRAPPLRHRRRDVASHDTPTTSWWTTVARQWSIHPPELVLRTAAVLGLAIVAAIVLAPLPNLHQALLGCSLIGVALLCSRAHRRADDRARVLLIMGFSIVLAGRYAWWRVTQTLHFNGAVEAIAGLLLLATEAYYWSVQAISHAQVAWPLRRPKAPVLVADPDLPHVDIFIPTYNEPLNIVRPTVLAAQNMDWPVEKLHIHLLDDGRRDEFADFAAAAGVNYVRRADNRHAKAGNINHALALTSGEFVAIFDCDHMPVRDFLRATMGWLIGQPDCAMVQTPHHLFSQDPMERNTRLERSIPNEGTLFYGLVQRGNDLWNASFFCGSCAVLRRSALDLIGGIAVETVTEDAHTALKLHRLGFTTTYLPRILAAGLATESLSGHIGQRIRWARGMAQIFRLDNPLLGPGLSLMQRLCYCNAMLHFFSALPRLILLITPLFYLVFGLQLLHTSMPTLLAYLIPHLLMGKIFESQVHGPYRASSWGNVYETLLAWYILRPTWTALVAPRLGRFNVTAKGGRIDREFFDWAIAAPYIVLVGVNMTGLIFGARTLISNVGPDAAAIWLNMGWAIFNLLTLGVAIRVATESQQIRSTPRVRVARPLPARLLVPSISPIQASLIDFSLNGVGLQTQVVRPIPKGTACQLELHDGNTWHTFSATLSRSNGTLLGLQIDRLDLLGQRNFLACTFTRSDLWRRQSSQRHLDRPFFEVRQLLRTGTSGYAHGLLLGCKEAWHTACRRLKRGQAR